MAESFSWTTALKWTVWAVLMTLVMAWLGRSRFRARPAPDTRTLAHPPSTMIVGLTGFAFFAGLAVVSNVFPNRTTTWWSTAIFVGFALLSVLMVVDYFRAAHELTDQGLRYRTLLVGTRKTLRWADVRAVRYAPAMKWFRLETRSGEVARISIMLIGLPRLARLLLDHAPADAVDSNALPILQATAAGHPPSVWA